MGGFYFHFEDFKKSKGFLRTLNWGAFLSPSGLWFVGGIAIIGFGIGKLEVESKWDDRLDKIFTVGNATPFGDVKQNGATIEGLFNTASHVVIQGRDGKKVTCSFEPWLLWVQTEGSGDPSSDAKCREIRNWFYEQSKRPSKATSTSETQPAAPYIFG